jgi:hypothetical protein
MGSSGDALMCSMCIAMPSWECLCLDVKGCHAGRMVSYGPRSRKGGLMELVFWPLTANDTVGCLEP